MIRRVLLLSTLLAVPSLADDSSATLGAGGIVLTKNADIRMTSEDLYLSPKAVRVHYTFANDSGRDIDALVAFPLPDIDNYEYSESPIGTTLGTTPNFVGFKLVIDGKPVNAQVEQRAFSGGRDVTATVLAAHAPLDVVIGGNYDRLGKLAPSDIAILTKAGLLEGGGGDDYHAKWTTKTKFFWTMHFPAGAMVAVDHTYQPVTGQTFFTPYALGEQEEYARYVHDYCIDAGTKAAIADGLARIKRAGGNDGLYNQYTTDFVIRTANNWKGPIGRFHLTLDKLKPSNVLSLCWPGDLKKTGATRFESTLTDFTPRADIELLVLEEPPPGGNR